MNRIISGKLRLEVQPTNLTDVVEQAVDSVRHSAEAKEISISESIEQRPTVVSGDHTRLQQVFWNLLSNAIKFTPKGGAVKITVQRVESHVETTFRDSGVGIKPEFLPHVFDRFRQEDSSSTRSYGGLGLGLSIVKKLVELHGGAVRAHSDGEGKGSTFVVSLPLSPVSSGVKRRGGDFKQTARRDPSISLDGVKILVVDDEPDARKLLKRILSQCDAMVSTAESAAQGLQLTRRQRPDVIVSDIGMPGADGYQFIQSVRKLSPSEGGRTPAIALTAFARSEDRTRAMLSGFQVHVAKPIEPQELVATVRSLVGRNA
jgi:CheY-like chemotaxis protein